ncbi:oxaloacetate decarboxylase subunit alpha [Mahella australiensis]|jgi:oxaloacetate decarboxylase alpha subunit|uniref:Conserved carboxylase region n=1 Tax=Mahella australiensis (strain DSM 15567 / CIP 107919 / 50-1 BON) TaxID=697281 RepID=F4A2B7_MAHA5|nr:oxaloacetate decarboxylase subunit alpha [Mahella australiensis]AEE96164.1 Conserved carboxylase region [Mahella australiensis 50-1 BON]
MAKVGITETVLRDAHQSLIATRMSTDEMLPIIDVIDQVGYHSIEMWGGATFDSALRFLHEDPWERLRKIRKRAKNTKLQMLLRGQNLLGYKHYPDDVVTEFVKRSVGNGMDIIRIFDALNDVRNLETAVRATKDAGGHAQGTIVYTISPVHTLDAYVDIAKQLVELGVDSICIKDMAGLLTPYATYDLVKRLKEVVDLPIQVHTHYTSGLASMSYLKAIEAGADVVDTAISPFSLGTSQPPTETLVAALKDTPYDTGLDLDVLNKIAEYFRPIKEKYMAMGTLDPKVLSVDVNALIYQVPGGMLSNLVSQLKQQNQLDKYDEVLKEVPRVRADLGYPPLVTPMSQMVGTQAVLNVITGERYKMIPNEVKAYVRGEYGRPPVPISEEIKKKIIGDEPVIDCRPADLLEPQLDKFRNEIKEYMEQEEDVLSYASFPQVAMDFFKYRRAQKYKIDSTLLDEENEVHPV